MTPLLATTSRTVYSFLGVSLLGLAWFVLPALDAPPFARHMVCHMLVVTAAAPALAVAIAGTELDPVRRFPDLTSPIAASMLELVAVWAWHAPVLHQLARTSVLGMALEQLSFLVAGLALWIAALGGDPTQRRARLIESTAALLFTSVHMTLLGALLALSSRSLYSAGHGHGALVSATVDQNLGGVTMVIAGGLAYGLGAILLMTRVLATPRLELR